MRFNAKLSAVKTSTQMPSTGSGASVSHQTVQWTRPTAPKAAMADKAMTSLPVNGVPMVAESSREYSMSMMVHMRAGTVPRGLMNIFDAMESSILTTAAISS